MKWLSRIAIAYMVSTLAIVAWLVLAPPTQFMEARLQSALNQAGMDVSGLDITQVGLNELVVENIRLGGSEAISLQKVRVSFSPLELQDMRVRHVVLSDLTVLATMGDKGMVIEGMPALVTPSEGNEKKTDIFSKESMDALPFESVTIEQSLLHITGKDMNITVPFSLTLDTKSGVMSVTLHEVSGTLGKEKLMIDKASLRLALDTKTKTAWHGEWKLENADYATLAEMMDTRVIGGKASLSSAQLTAEAQLLGKPPLTSAEVMLSQPLDGRTGTVRVRNAEALWADGLIRAHDVELPLSAIDKDILVPLSVTHLDMAKAAQEIGGDKLKATGIIGGDVVLAVNGKGEVTSITGALGAMENGQLHVSPDLLPAATQNIEFVGKLLENFNYQQLQLQLTADNNRPALLLSASGNNPEVENGRKVNLNVKFTGDVLEFLQYSVLRWQDPVKGIRDYHE